MIADDTPIKTGNKKEENMENQRMSVKEAAKILGRTENYIRYAMDKKLIDIGDVIPSRTGKSKKYEIYRAKVMRRVGLA